ncbi:MAG TPA: hypothetical protein VHF22_09405, partial [Planctomycetota bacterium]|nr:hypothetical protein [Planctomycetota bacterium]
EATGAPSGLAAARLVETRTAAGPQLVATLESVHVPGFAPGPLGALISAARSLWSGEASTPAVSCPNLAGFAAADLAGLAIRRTATAFAGYLCVADAADPLCAARFTSLDIT